MTDWLPIVLAAMSGLCLGYCLVKLTLGRGARAGYGEFFAALTLGIIILGWVATVLAELGWFRAWLLGLLLAVPAVAIAVLWHRREREPAEAGQREIRLGVDRLRRWERGMIGLWLVAAGWLFFRPHEAFQGGADAGVYVSLGAEIARNGGFRIVDETLAGLDPALTKAVLRPLPNTPGAVAYLLPGYYVTDLMRGELTPQFYPLHPVLQAIAFESAGGGAAGMRAELLLAGVWMLLGTLAVYLTARDVGGPFAGALTLAGLSLCALQVWFARYPTSEALTQYLLWAGIWSGGRWLGEVQPQRLWALLAGCAFGAVFLVRIDSVALLPVFALVLFWRSARGWRRADTWFALPFAFLVVHSLLHGHFLSAPYFYETVGYGLILLSRLWPLLIIAAIAAAVVLLRLGRESNLRSLARFRRPVLLALVGLLLGYAIYGWFLRPGLGGPVTRSDFFSGGEIPVTNHENWIRLGWYLHPVGIWLGVFGIGLLLWRVNGKTVLLVVLGCLFSALYLWNISANPHHVYVMRRYVPAVMPFFILGGAYLLGHRGFGREGWTSFRGRPAYPAGPILTATLALVWLAGLAWSARGFVSQVDRDGLIDQFDVWAQSLPPDSILLFDDQNPVSLGDVLGTPLRFVYGPDVLSLRKDPKDVTAALVESIKTWQNNERPVIWIGPTDWLDEQGIAYHTEAVTFESRRLESSYAHKPQAVISETIPLEVSYLESR